MATKISVAAVGSMTICTSYLGLLIAVSHALGFGATSGVGNAIGEGDEQLGKMVAVLAYV